MSEELKNPVYASIPMTEEHFEARQVETNLYRQKQVEKMLPEEQEKMKIIENVSKQLEDAKIPFYLFASPINDDELKKSPQFWQFNRLSYEEGFKKSRNFSTLRGMFYLIPAVARAIFIGKPQVIMAYDKNKEIMYGFDSDIGKMMLSVNANKVMREIEKEVGL